jgi:Domain of unknown function (DUF4286)
MIIYNITTLVSWPIHDDWRNWMMDEYLPELLATKLFTHFQMVRLMEVNEDEGPTYAVQLYMNDTTDFNSYRDKHLEWFQQKEKAAWGDYATSFASLMQVIN